MPGWQGTRGYVGDLFAIPQHLKQLGPFMDTRGSDGQVVYELRANFGRDAAELRTRFANYFDAIPVKVEVL
ncbi:hypothetical protein [Rhodococcus globerulus]|uniref:hypothetical protein n=1 Tax=Rhodococcus globerulus TaxID=33008 RepID=UPI0030191BA3